MNIWMVNHYAIPPDRAGGTRHYFLGKELVKRGHSVTIFAASFDHFARSEIRLDPGQLWKVETFDGVNFVWVRTPPYPGNTLARFWNMVVFALRVGRTAVGAGLARPDIVLGSTPHLFAPWAALRMSRRWRVPFVMEVRDLWPQTFIDFGQFSARHPAILFFAWLEKYLYRRAYRIVTLLPAAGPYMATHGARAEHVVCVPNGVEVEFGTVENPAPRTVEGPFTLMYAGAHGIANALDTVLDAAKQLQVDPDADRKYLIRLIGHGPEKERLQTRARDEAIRLVRFEASVPKHEVYARMQEADGFLMMLRDSPVFRWGVSPNKLMDYFLSARPVIFGVKSPNDPVAEARAGISIPPEDPAALADAIRRLAALSTNERQAMGERGRRYVQEHHSFRRLAEKLEDVLISTTR